MLAGLRGRATDLGFAAAWGAVRGAPAGLSARAFRAAADAAAVRNGPGTRQLRKNLRRVAGAAASEVELDELVAAALLCLVLGSLTSYIRARAEAAGMNATVGIAERAERLIIVLVGTGLSGEHLDVPYVQAAALWILVGASTITVVQRLVAVRRQSRPAPQPDPAAAPAPVVAER